MMKSMRNLVLVLFGAVLFLAGMAAAEDRTIFHITTDKTLTDWVEVTQLLDDFAWPSEADPSGQEERGYRYYGRLAADRGDMGGGLQEHSITVTNGVLIVLATSGPQGTSWVGRWHSTSHTALETAEVLNFSAPLSSLIHENWQPLISALYVSVKGTGTIKMELKGSGNNLLTSWTTTGNWGPGFEEVRFDITNPTAYPAVKLINLVVESPSLLEFEEVGMKLSIPKWLHDDILRYAFATSYAALLRGYDPASGYTRDHVHWPAGQFDSLPGCGFQALGAALAHDLGLLTSDTARQIVSQSVAAISTTPKHKGLLPHWIEHGTSKDWSTVDTGLALESSLLACAILNMPNEEATILSMIDAVDWDPLTTQGLVSHGYMPDGSRSPYVWANWDGEGAIVQLLRLIQDPQASLFNMDATFPVYCGRGFIAEIAGLFTPQFAILDIKDRYGISWRTLRTDMLAAQKAYYPTNFPGSLAATAGLYGLSPIETIDADANTTYTELGVGTPTCSPIDGGGWIGPHYAAMAGTLDVESATHFLTALRQIGVLQPLIGLPEGVKAGNSGSTPERWHSAQITLNGFFNVVGLYHAIRMRDGGTDVIYKTALAHPRLTSALNALFPRNGVRNSLWMMY
jgi:hypothetical protein